ncbi:hypothetical protein LXL04_011987 [Taraxacum kok-saghyz]
MVVEDPRASEDLAPSFTTDPHPEDEESSWAGDERDDSLGEDNSDIGIGEDEAPEVFPTPMTEHSPYASNTVHEDHEESHVGFDSHNEAAGGGDQSQVIMTSPLSTPNSSGGPTKVVESFGPAGLSSPAVQPSKEYNAEATHLEPNPRHLLACEVPSAPLADSYVVLLDDPSEEKIDKDLANLEATSRFWENKACRLNKIKRDLKMKRIRSPCNCRVKVKRNGASCSHVFMSGGTQDGAASIVERDGNESSDSEVLIKRSNRRILKCDSALHSREEKEKKILSEAKVTNSIGAAIGFELDGFQEHMIEAIAVLGENFTQ